MAKTTGKVVKIKQIKYTKKAIIMLTVAALQFIYISKHLFFLIPS